jgi:hypothetical protein
VKTAEHVDSLVTKHNIIESLRKIVTSTLAEDSFHSEAQQRSIMASAFALMTKLYAKKPEELAKLIAETIPIALKKFPKDNDIRRVSMEVLGVLASSCASSIRYYCRWHASGVHSFVLIRKFLLL